MNDYKPYSYLYKKTTKPETLTSCFVVWVPADKNLSLRAGDPETIGSKTFIRYSIVDASGEIPARQEDYEHEFDWDGYSHEVKVIIGSGSGANGGTSYTHSEETE